MSYAPPKCIGITRWADSVDDRTVEFWAEAVRRQQREIAMAYGWPPPSVYTFGREVELPSSECVLVALVEDDGNPESAGWHGYLAGVPISLVGVQESSSPSVVLSHECAEYAGNVDLSQWVTAPDGRRWWRELCDAVDGQSYVIDVELFGERRSVAVSDWLRPAYFAQPGVVYEIPLNGHVFDRMGLLSEPWSVYPGGYAIVERDGVMEQIGASRRTKPRRPGSRTQQILDAHKARVRVGR